MNDPHSVMLLKDAFTVKDSKLKVNIMGVIVETSFPRRSSGSDCVCVVRIVDEWHQKPEIPVIIFTERLDELPHVKSCGDIILLNRIVMTVYDREVSAVFNKKYSSFALFEGKSGDITPYQASSTFCLRNPNDLFLTRMRMWLLNYQPDGGGSDYLVSLKEIKEGRFFDLVCKILLVSEVSQDEWMLFVWNGTDAPALSFETKLEDEAKNSLPLHLEPSPLARETLCTFPTVGTILRVSGPPGVKLGQHFQGCGQWVRLRNISCRACSGLWHGIMMPTSKLRSLPDKDQYVTQHQRDYNDRISTYGCVPLLSYQCPRTTVTNLELKCVTLMDILTSSEVTAVFKTVVRVVATDPWKVEDFCSPGGVHDYRIRFTLEDPTARVHAYLYAEEGDKFFGGKPPLNVLTSKRNILLGINEKENSEDNNNAPRNPPWIECCIKSYYRDKSNAWGSRRFQIFGTILIP
ncbi:protection of telomeres protein 1b-like isoform X2 [Macadamia integrifolia]|uniref:protection of telomeres protein 1b-like isoform X2 n=1 Tax=Macadamia integrifolia TaxID=60698 RepID=UPI001C4E5A88|nr:protection of telomeres protein 1b-like isoform X2 [Macadamia integrifolia]